MIFWLSRSAKNTFCKRKQLIVLGRNGILFFPLFLENFRRQQHLIFQAIVGNIKNDIFNIRDISIEP